MANWCNARLIVAGRRADVLSFSQLARKRPTTIFGQDMLHGEGGELSSERMESLGLGLSKKLYKFQIRNDDGREHFCRVSKRFQALCFVLVYFDPNDSLNGSYFITKGRARGFEISDKMSETIMAKHGLTEEVFNGDWSDDNEVQYWEASWDLMDLSEAHWEKTLLKAIRN